MRTTLVCGLLGAGKTTFITNILEGSSEKTVVLVNDFGETGVDGEVFTAGGIEAIELPSGCVCCTLKFDLVTTVRKVLAEFGPEHLVIEPSGVASPLGVLEAVESLDIGPVTVVGIVDAAEFAELYGQDVYGPFFREQVSMSDVVLVNKADIAGRSRTAETMKLVEQINPSAVLFETERARLGSGLPSHSGRRGVPRGTGHALRFDTLCMKVGNSVPLERARSFFARCAEGSLGGVVRAKALLVTEEGPYRFDLSSGRVEVSPFEGGTTEGRLVVFGHSLRKDEMESFMKGPTS